MGEFFMNFTNQLPFMKILSSKYLLKVLIKMSLFNSPVIALILVAIAVLLPVSDGARGNSPLIF